MPEVTSALKPACVSRSTSGSSDTVSPTLAPCSQISGPSGRATPGAPRRSPSRSDVLLALIEAQRQQAPASGLAANVATR